MHFDTGLYWYFDTVGPLTLFQATSFRLVQIETIKFCQQQNKGDQTIEILFRRVENTGRKCWLPAFFPFSIMFSKAFFLRVIKSQDFVAKS